MPASSVTVSCVPEFFRPGSRTASGQLRAQPANLSSTSSLSSSIDGKSSVEATSISNLASYYHQLPHLQPSVGMTPTSAILPSAELSPYTPPHPTPQDTRDATVKPIETSPPKNRRRRNRTIYTGMQIRGLETCFNVNKYPDIETRENLALAIGMSEARVQVWFQNRRARLRRQERDSKRKPASQSDDVTGADDISSACGEESTGRVVTSEEVADEQEEIDVVGISEEDDSNMKTSSSDPTVISNLSASSLEGAPLFSISPPRICTKPCCCSPFVLPYSYFQQRLLSSSYQLPVHPGFYPSYAVGAPPRMNMPSLFYNYPPRVPLQRPNPAGGIVPVSFS